MRTEYKNLPNRCPNCGHRLGMVEGTNCTVVMGAPKDPSKTHGCECQKHYRR